MNMFKLLSILFLSLFFVACLNNAAFETPESATPKNHVATSVGTITVGADRFGAYLPLLDDKSVAIIANATSVVNDQHLVDALLAKQVQVRKIFAPEHGFRGQKDAGETINDEIDEKTGLPIHSLYGNYKKPNAEILSDVDVMLFDIQDVGVRFYTYLSTLHYVMESCAENNVPLILLDRPNPNGHYIDGPVLQSEFSSFIGLHPVPLVYGMTIGEYGLMINGEEWLKNGVKCDLTVISLDSYSHQSEYTLPVNPSPNLPNKQAIRLYPSLALFEGTRVSIGRGTNFPFQVIGHPEYPGKEFTFTPNPTPGAMSPKLEGEICNGIDLRQFKFNPKTANSHLRLEWLVDFYAKLPDKESFFLANNFFNKLSGNAALMQQIESGMSAEDIRESWQADLDAFQTVREPYILYK